MLLAATIGIPAFHVSANPSGASVDWAAFGAAIFADEALSADGKTSCASCHVPSKAFADGRPVAIGIGGQASVRNTPSLRNTATHETFFWDGRRAALESQVLDPLVNPHEHGLASVDQAAAIVRSSRTYSAFPQARTATPDSIAQALAAYVRSLGESTSRFDRYWVEKDNTALTDEERRGFEVFRGSAHCTSCHSIEGRRANFTDNAFHSVGIAQPGHAANLQEVVLRSVRSNPLELEQLITSDPAIAALGRFNVSKSPLDIGKYRTPSLRNVALTSPYMHDGSIPTLDAAVELELYYRSAQQGRLVILTPREKADLVAFLRALTSESLENNQGPK